jgi:hypothetical protein
VQPWASDTPPFIDIIVGWDWTGMTEEQKASIAAMDAIRPLSDEEVLARLTPEEQTIWLKGRLALIDPVQYEKLYPTEKTPEELADQQFHEWAMAHPVEYKQLTDKLKTPEQLQQEAFSMWAITHPEEANKLAQSLKSPDEIKAQLEAQIQLAHPDILPKPVMQTVPAVETQTILNSRQPHFTNP